MAFHAVGLKRALLFGAVGAFLAAALTMLMPNYYRSEARILPSESKGSLGNLGALSSAVAAMGLALPGGEGDDANFVDILQSRWLRERLLGMRFQFKARAWRFGQAQDVNATLIEYLKAKDVDTALGELGRWINVNRELKSKIVIITAETKSPALSQGLVQQSLALLEEFVQGKGRTRAGAKAIFLEARIKEARQDLDQSEQELLAFLDRNRNFQQSADPAIRLKGIRLESELKLKQQITTTLALSREQALMEEKRDIPIVNVMDQASLPVRKSRPRRTLITLLAFFLLSAGEWAWSQRKELKLFLQAE